MFDHENTIWDVIRQGHSAQLMRDGQLAFDPNQIHPEYGTPLAFAIVCGRGNVVHTLLRFEPWLGYEHRGDSLLHLAVRHASRNEVAMLLAAGIPPDVTNPQGESPLHYAARFDKPAAAVELLARGADPRLLNQDGKPASHVALCSDHLTVARTIMDCVPRMIPNREQDTELHLACVLRLADFVAYLGQRFGDVNRQDREGRTPLHLSVMRGDPESVKNLLAAGADPRIADRHGSLPADQLIDSAENRDQLRTLLA